MDTTSSDVWDMIRNDKSIKIIHLRRENMLRTHISRLIAGKTDQWASKKQTNVNIKNKKVELNIPKLFDDFEQIEKLEWIFR